MEHLPIVIFEIVLCVFIAFAVLAEILLKQITNQQKKIKKLETELIKHKRYSDFLRTDIMTLKTRFKISVPIFRVDYEYIKLSDAEYIFR